MSSRPAPEVRVGVALGTRKGARSPHSPSRAWRTLLPDRAPGSLHSQVHCPPLVHHCRPLHLDSMASLFFSYYPDTQTGLHEWWDLRLG